MSSLQECICFCLNGERYAHDVLSVREIMRYQEPTPVPGAPPEVDGVLNIRGEVITVVSGHALLSGGVADTEQHDQWRVMVLEGQEGCVGVTVDAVQEIVAIDPERIEPTPAAVDSSYIEGTVEHEGELLIVTDLVALES